MGDIIYRIQTQNGEYIGKLSNTDILWAHTQKWYYNNNGHQSTWEKDWEAQVNNVGMANQTFVQSVNYWDLSTVRSNIIASGLPGDLLNKLNDLWLKDDLEVTEALLIILSKKHSHNIGQQIDFLTREASRPEDYVSLEEFRRRKTAAFDSLLPNIYLNFKKRKKPVIEEATEELEKMLQEATFQTGSRKGTVNITNKKEVAKAISLTITQKTIDDITRQLTSKIKDKEGNIKQGKEYLQKYIEELEQSLKSIVYTKSSNIRKHNGKNITYGEVFKALYENIAENKEATLNNDAEEDSRRIASEVLTKWIQTTNINSILTGGISVDPQTDESWQQKVKKRFTDTISNILDTAINYDPEYSNVGGWLEQQLALNGESMSLAAYYDKYKNPDKETFDNTSLMEETSPRDNNYLTSNWPPIYAEQIVLWLKSKHPDAFLLQRRDLVGGFKRDVESYKEITYY